MKIFKDIQEAGEIIHDNKYGCQVLDGLGGKTIEEMSKQFPNGIKVFTEKGDYWIWPEEKNVNNNPDKEKLISDINDLIILLESMKTNLLNREIMAASVTSVSVLSGSVSLEGELKKYIKKIQKIDNFFD